MATRLDRLLLLLESGSTPVIRQSAAKQLGEVQRLHPHELNNLLSKVHAYLGNNQWETRIAAGMAVEAIASNVDQWKPVGIPSLSGDCDLKANSLKEGRLEIEHFDVQKVLIRGSCLLGSHGAEYDVEENVSLDDKEKLLKQKELMNKRLGLGVADAYCQEELVKEEDLVLKYTATVNTTSQGSIEELIDEQLLPVKSEMSAREKNRAKRKAKQQAKQTAAGHEQDKKNGETSDGEPACKKYKMSNGPPESPAGDLTPATDCAVDNTVNMDEIEDWPFEQFCELLMHDLFHSSWEKRHGAATALREVVKLHGKGAGLSTDTLSHWMELANQMWLEDVAVRLVCVLALDRFGDFVSDEVVAPVRETCAQTLGVTLHHMTVQSVKEVLRILNQLLRQGEWEVRHGGLLGIKYLLAVRQDITDVLLPFVLPSICCCLEDPSDDVRAVAADALLPVTDGLVRSFPEKVEAIVDTLWRILVDLDDLTSSTNSIMTLLSSILSHPDVNSERYHQMLSLTSLVPRLWPFLRHNIMSVRRAALKTLSTLLMKSSVQVGWVLPILSHALRHIYQRCLLETEPELLQDILQVWSLLLSSVPPEHLLGIAAQYFSAWMSLMMQPAYVAFDRSQIIESRHETREQHQNRSQMTAEPVSEAKDYIGGNMSLNAPTAERDVVVIRARQNAAKLLGLLSTYIARFGRHHVEGVSCSCLEALGNLFTFYLSSKSAVQKMSTAYTIVEWISSDKDGCLCPEAVKTKLDECLTEVVYYDEVAFLFTRLQTECRELLANLQLQGIKLDPPFTIESVLTLENANTLCVEVFDSVKSKIKPSYMSLLEERRSSIQTLVAQTSSDLQVITNRIQCSVAGAIVSLKDLPEKMNPIVRPLMDALKREKNLELQECAGNSLAHLLPLCANRLPCPIPKIIKNLCTMLCSDPKYTPTVGKELGDNAPLDGVSCDKHNGILTLYTQRQTPVPTRGRRPAQRRVAVNVDLCHDAASGVGENESSRQPPMTQRRGAALALTAITKEAGAELPEKINTLWETIWGPLKQLKETSVSGSDSTIDNDSFAQELVNSLQVLQVVAPAIQSTLQPVLADSVELLAIAVRSPFTVVRHMTSRSLAVLCRLLPSDIMEYFIEHILPLLSLPESTVNQRQGCIEALALMIEQLSIDVVPFIVLLIVPVLGRMSDHDQSVRLMATNVFATLVRLLPLERTSASDSLVMSSLLLEKQKEDEKKFIEQLLDGKKIENFEIPIPLNVELRRYQQEGVNWLAFLAKYNLHGILCDDMGLGKTLQSLCIVAADHKKKEQVTKAGGQEESKLLPSIVVCPPTLTGHWLFEVEKLVAGGYLKPLHYVGPPSERLRLQKMINNYNLVLASYDVVRNDIDFFSKIKWNYCILDEGQIIKNSKTKISKAVKQLDSNHRLILSGTPIQNNVLELWSLFDFLMPGFLGTEKQFQTCFGRPILQSRDAKSSTREQEAGALAMEALHRQVLPFLLRRLKDDVLQDLPPKIIQDYYCDLSPIQIQLYEDFAKSQVKKSVSSLVDSEEEEDVEPKKEEVEANEVKNSMKAMHIFQALQYLRKVCNHPSLVLTPNHPEFSRIMGQLKSENSSLRDLQHAPKLVALKQLLNDCGIGVCGSEASEMPVVNQHRVLLFCQLKMMLDIVEQDLLKSHMSSVTYLRLDGSVPAGSRHQIVNRFNNDPSIDILLLTTQVGGLGLNLTGADTVIFVEHDWNPSKDLQAMDRAHRIGQKKVVNVYRLITRGTLEEKIMGLQRFKINIANTVINQDNSSIASMGTNQLLDLFTVDRTSSSEKPVTKPDHDDSTAEKHSKQSMRAVLDGLGDLWDSKEYEKEYDVDSFLSSLKNCD